MYPPCTFSTGMYAFVVCAGMFRGLQHNQLRRIEINTFQQLSSLRVLWVNTYQRLELQNTVLTPSGDKMLTQFVCVCVCLCVRACVCVRIFLRDLSCNSIEWIHPEAFTSLHSLIKLWVTTAQTVSIPYHHVLRHCQDYLLGPYLNYLKHNYQTRNARNFVGGTRALLLLYWRDKSLLRPTRI